MQNSDRISLKVQGVVGIGLIRILEGIQE